MRKECWGDVDLEKYNIIFSRWIIRKKDDLNYKN